METPSPDRLGFFDFTTCSSITNNNPFGSTFTSNEDSGYSLSYFLSSRGLFLSSVVTSTTDSTYQKRGFSMSAVSAFRNNAGIPGNGTYLFVFYDLDHNASVYKTTISSNSFTSLTLLSGDSVGLYYHSNSGYLYLHGIDNSTIVLSGFEILRYSSDYQLSTWEPVSSVIPLDSDSLNTPTLAVRTDLDITSYQIGGVRPSLPKKGQVWCLVENQRITSIQIYNGSAWESCDGRIWTGERWIPASSYNIITLQDMYDIVDSTPNYEYIYTESGFWAWWQKAWIAFTDKLFSILGSGSGGSGGSGADGGDGSTVLRDVDFDADIVLVNPDDEDGKTFWQFILLVIDGGKSVVGGVRHLFSGVVSLVPESMSVISGSFDSGGSAVGALDGTSLDPDAADLPATASLEDSESEVSDPWRYR